MTPIKHFFIFLLLVVTASSIWAQTEGQIYSPRKYHNVVYVNNGWIIRGKILDHGKEKLTIETSNMNVFVFDQSQIDSIRLERIPKTSKRGAFVPEFHYQHTGHVTRLQVSLPFGQSSHWYFSGSPHLDIQVMRGYKFHKLLQVSGGTGATLFSRGLLLPTYVDIRSDLTATKETVFLYGQLGYNFRGFANEDRDGWQAPNVYNFRGGLYMGFGGGMKIHSFQKTAYEFTIGWREYNAREYREIFDQGITENFFKVRRLLFGFGISF